MPDNPLGHPICPFCHAPMKEVGHWRTVDGLHRNTRYECRCDGRVHTTVQQTEETA